MHNDKRSMLIISDLHLASGYDPQTGRYDRNEDFFYDEAFSRLIDYLIKRGNDEQRGWRLVILGDMVDFLQVDPHVYGSTTDEAATIQKLDLIIAGHPTFFRALARFIAAGHLLDIVLGNHDIEFIWPGVQARLREQIGTLIAQQEGDARVAQQRVVFHPWIFYLPGVLYAEHGHQYDRLNCFTEQLHPHLKNEPDLIELPLGSFFVLYLFNNIEKIDPFADNVRPMTRYLVWGLMRHPMRTIKTLGSHLYFFVRVLWKANHRSLGELDRRRAAYRARHIARYADQIGLPSATVGAIDALSPPPALTNWRVLLNELFLQPARRLLLAPMPLVIGSAVLYPLVNRLEPRLRWPLSIMGGMITSALQKRWLLRPPTRSDNMLLAAARKIHALLEQANAGVPVYVFGHTHTAELFTFGQQATPRYINSGTWTPIIPTEFDLLGTRERFTAVEVTHSDGGAIIAELKVWNDAAGRMERMPLLTHH